MSATAAQQTPAVPPRPSRSQDKDQMPKIPPRPIKNRIERSLSPNPDRFAPSPLNDEFLNKSPRSKHLSPTKLAFPSDPIDRAASVEMPSVGEEGMEYAVVAEELTQSRRQSTSPEQTRTVGEDIKLHAPKPSLPAVSAKQRVAAVTRTDSDRAASFGIGRPSSDEVTPSNRSLKKKASTASQLSTTESHTEEEHGIPEIGQQVPMYRDAGDVQAPSPAPGSEPPKKHHARKTSARGLPPGSYGLHGHGVVSNDKLDKMYYQKHPDELKKERHSHHHDRPNDFSMSSDDLNKIVRDTHGRGLGLGTRDLAGTPSEQIGWQAIEESTSRLNSPHPASAELARPAKTERSASDSGNGVIHVEEPSRRRSVMFSDGETAGVDDFQGRAETPILAADEVAKDPLAYEHEPAVEPPRERRGSAYEMEEPQSRPTSRPASLYKVPSSEIRSTPLEDVVEYEPLFEDDKVNAEKKSARKSFEEYKARFPSKDIWEDAPNSVHYTAEVSTPDIPEEKDEGEEQKTVSENIMDIPPREGETPAQAFARHQEELAQKEFQQDPEAFLHRKQKPTFVQHHAHLAKQIKSERPSMSQRFPSRDVWEDTPDSLKLETTVSTPQQESGDAASPSVESKPSIPQRPGRKAAETTSPSSDKPAVPERPNAGAKPPVSDRPKPQIPPRPAKQGSGSSDKDADAAPRSKPAVPVRPMGSKIAALQAGFMSDLNKRLQLGPQAPKKEEQPAEEDGAAPVEEKEKVPLSDARKGRARGPQRRAPRSSPSPAAALSGASEQKSAATLAFSTTVTTFSIDPEDGGVSVPVGRAPASQPASAVEKEEPVTEKATTAAAVAEHELEKAAPEEKRAHPAPADVAAHEIEKAPEAEAPAAAFEKTETLATNTAGETLLETKVSEDAEDNKKTVEPKEVDEVVKN